KHSDNAKRIGCHTGLRTHERIARDTGASCLSANPLGEPFQIERPTLITLNAAAHAFPTFAVTFEVTVLKLQPGPTRRLGDEPDFPFTGPVRIGFDLPARADVPAQKHAVRRLKSQHTRPAAFAA